MNCPGKGELIARYIMDELSASSRVELEEHIRNCPSCRAEHLFAENLEDALLNQRLIPSPSGLEEGIMEAVNSMERESLESRIIEIARNRKKFNFRRDFLPEFAYSIAAVFVSMFLASYWPNVSGFFSPAKADTFLSAVMIRGMWESIGVINILYSLIILLSLGLGLMSAFHPPRNLHVKRLLYHWYI